MLEKLNRAAQQAAEDVSRRQFLGRFGRGVMGWAAALGGLLALPAIARGAPGRRSCDASSSAACNGLMEGDTCYEGRYVGTCRGGSKGPKDGTVPCSCVYREPRRRGD